MSSCVSVLNFALFISFACGYQVWNTTAIFSFSEPCCSPLLHRNSQFPISSLQYFIFRWTLQERNSGGWTELPTSHQRWRGPARIAGRHTDSSKRLFALKLQHLSSRNCLQTVTQTQTVWDGAWIPSRTAWRSVTATPGLLYKKKMRRVPPQAKSSCGQMDRTESTILKKIIIFI